MFCVFTEVSMAQDDSNFLIKQCLKKVKSLLRIHEVQPLQ